MQRTQISLTVEERQLLDEVSARTGRSLASLIRTAVRTTYGPPRSTDQDLLAMRQAFGAWDGRRADGATYVEGLRSGARLSAAAHPAEPRR